MTILNFLANFEVKIRFQNLKHSSKKCIVLEDFQ